MVCAVMGGGACGIGVFVRCRGGGALAFSRACGCVYACVCVCPVGRVVVMQEWFVCGWGGERPRVLVICACVCGLGVRVCGDAGHVVVRVSSVLSRVLRVA